MAIPDLSPAIYAALIGASDIADNLASYEGAPAVFTRRPVPPKAGYPMIVADGDVAVTDQDMITGALPVVVRDISIYGQNDSSAHYRAVEALGRAVRDLFHRNRQSLSVPGWDVLDIICRGPLVGPTDDEVSASRIVTLTVRLSPA